MAVKRYDTSVNMKGVNRKMYFTRGIRNSYCNVLLFVFLVFSNFENSATAGVVDMSCAAVRPLFEAKGLPATEIYKDPINGSHLKICSGTIPLPLEDLSPTGSSSNGAGAQGGTCCSDAVEGRLDLLSRQQFDRTVKESLAKLASVLGTRSQRFNDFFRELLSRSKIEFHAMFRRTYGVIYEQNSYVFTDLFAELERYYARGNVDLAEEMDGFFNTLYQKMFTVLNSQYSFDDKYLGCVSEHMKELKPFGDVPDKLSVQVKRSFIATRTYAQALNTASEVVKNMLALKPSSECTRALMRMQHCGTCSGLPQRACSDFCINVMKGCLALHAELDSEWNNFVGAMEKVSDRLIGPFNIEMVVEPIDIKISEAIMNFQENGHAVSQQVFEKCGKPVLGRRRRHSTKSEEILSMQRRYERHVNTDADFEINFEGSIAPSNESREKRGVSTSRELELEHLQFPSSTNGNGKRKNGGGGNRQNNRKHQKVNSGEETTPASNQPSLEKLIKDIRTKVKDTAKFWSHLPYQICNNDDVAAAPSKDSDCWNGKAIERYSHPMVGDGLAAQKQNPEVVVDVSKPSSLLNEQLLSLRTIVNNLRNAYNGLDVEWSEYEEAYYGSGSGSGNGVIDSDDEDSIHTGSGGGNDNYNIDTVHKPDIYSPNGNIPNREIDNNDLDIRTNINDDLPNIHTNTIDRHGPGHTHGGTSGSSNKAEMSLSRALMGYLFPIVVMWFGGMFAEML